ncbi:MAG: hypothetical protein HY673_25190 [Chloroflexi bacterium]|nr:hypothetical protein [Chloroflexota bacterium]
MSKQNHNCAVQAAEIQSRASSAATTGRDAANGGATGRSEAAGTRRRAARQAKGLVATRRRVPFCLASVLLSALFLLGCAAEVTPPPPARATATPGPAKTGPEATQKPVATTKTPAPTREPQRPAEPDYYQGKTIEILAATAAGGGTDTVARVTATFLPKHIPGTPRIVVRNQPGGAGAVANNIFSQRVKPDGLTLLQNSTSPIAMQMKQNEIVRYDLTKYEYVGNISREAVVILVRKGQTWRLTDPRAPPLVIGTREGEEGWQAVFMWGKELLGWNVRWVPGYGGTGEIELAFRRGEVDVLGSANATIIGRLNQEGIIEYLAVEDSVVAGKFARRPDMPDVPSSFELVGEKIPKGVAWQAYLAWIGPKLIDKSLAAPPGTPPKVMDILTKAYTAMTRDPRFKETMGRVDTDVYTVSTGEETARVIKDVLSASPEVLNYTRELQKKVGIIK